MQLSHLLPPLLGLLICFQNLIPSLSQTTTPTSSSPFSECAPLPYACGGANITISYPFRLDVRPDYCGHLGYYVSCTSDNSTLNILIGRKNNFQITSIDYVNSLLNIVDTANLQQSCPDQSYTSTSIDPALFQYSDRDRNITLYINCSTTASSSIPSGLTDIGCLTGQHSYYRLNNGTALDDLLGLTCSSTVEVPLQQEAAQDLVSGKLQLAQALQRGFSVRWVAGGDWCGGCVSSGGYCGYNSTRPEEHTCFCPQGTFVGSCDSDDGTHTRRIIIGVVCGIGGFLFACIICFFCYRHKLNQHLRSTTVPVQNFSANSFSKKKQESVSFHCETPLFPYEELVEATNGFDASRELGDGGYGVVYKGVLGDGRVVAVKRLYETSYKRIEQFMNEVKILSGLRHPNLVTLYGSTSPNSPHLLLVYEFVSNGTLADHLHQPLKSKSLPLSLRLKMAIDTAASLSYLHSVDIMHRDVKSSNILVDNNFNVKVADFGLSRLFPPNATHVSTAPQGTPGYLDPEYYRFYQLTDKSDVYSFGVVLMELISSRPAVDTDRKPNEISLAMAAVGKIQNGDLGQLVDPGLGFETDREANGVLTKMAELAFRCLQVEREMRPSMKEVLEGLREIEDGVCCDGEESEIKIAEDRMSKSSAPMSPDSVINNWQSRSTTPNTSGQV